MSSLITVTNKHNGTVNQLLEQSAKARNIEYNPLFTESFSKIPEDLDQTSVAYRIDTGVRAMDIERALIAAGATTFRSSLDISFSGDNTLSASLAHKYAGVPIPTTEFFPSKDRSALASSVDELGGFPIIIKVAGGSHGVGVMKIESMASLASVVDFLFRSNKQFILRKFIVSSSHARLIVLGQMVIDSIRYQAPAGDFRTNAGKDPIVEKASFSRETQDIAVRAVQTLGLEFGGVDIISDKDGNDFVMEVNFPCFFPRCQLLTGVDISGMMLDYLLAKSKRNSSTR